MLKKLFAASFIILALPKFSIAGDVDYTILTDSVVVVPLIVAIFMVATFLVSLYFIILGVRSIFTLVCLYYDVEKLKKNIASLKE